MEKRAVVDREHTLPEDNEKTASADESCLEEHATRRLSDTVCKQLAGRGCGCSSSPCQ